MLYCKENSGLWHQEYGTRPIGLFSNCLHRQQECECNAKRYQITLKIFFGYPSIKNLLHVPHLLSHVTPPVNKHPLCINKQRSRASPYKNAYPLPNLDEKYWRIKASCHWHHLEWGRENAKPSILSTLYWAGKQSQNWVEQHERKRRWCRAQTILFYFTLLP